jgi:hypothetical protein
MRNLRLTIWHLLLVILIAVGSLIGVLAGVRTILPTWQTPWLLPLLVLIAADAVITQWVVERERQTLSEQGILRVVEATLLIVATRIASLAGEGAPLSNMSTWLRDPLAFFGGRFSEYALFAVATWMIATVLAHRMTHLSSEPPHTSVRGLPIDQAVLLADRAAALMRFDRLWVTLTVLGLAGVVLALYRTPLLQILASWSTLQLLLAVLGCGLGGVLLHSEGQLDQLRYRWQIEQLDIAPAVARRWRRTSWLLAAGALVIALALGGLVLNVPPPPPLAPVFNLLFGVLVLLTWLIVALLTLLVLPFAWLLSLLRGDAAPPPPSFQPPPLPPLEQTTGDRPLLPALVFWGCVALLLGLAVLHYLRQRDDVRLLLGRWRGWRWLVRIWGHAVADLRNWSDLALQRLAHLRRPRRRAAARRKPVRGARAQLRVLYRRMVRLAARQGVAHSASQTPYEFSRVLGRTLPTIDQEANDLADAYVSAEYGPASPNAGDVRRARRVWRRIERVLLRKR